MVVPGSCAPAAPSRWRVTASRLLAVLVALLIASTFDVRPAAAQTAPPETRAPVAIEFPRDDGPHAALTEWWYYTGHLQTADGRSYGFEEVFFKAKRGVLSGYAAHAAITDDARRQFTYDQRAVMGGVGVSRPGAGFDLTLGDWSMSGANGDDRIAAAVPGYAFQLTLRSQKRPALHGGSGYIVYGQGLASYYYSRTRLAVAGTLWVDGQASPVTGQAWMDHQWSDIPRVSQAGWDWYSLQLSDNTELMFYSFRDQQDRPVLGIGTQVYKDGSIVVLDQAAVNVRAIGSWQSPHSSATYPSGWIVQIPSLNLSLTLTPTQVDQELDTRKSTLVTYWEGQIVAKGTRGSERVEGYGYVELTGYTRARDGIVP